MVFGDKVHGRLHVSDGAFPHRNVRRGHLAIANSGEVEPQHPKAALGHRSG